MTSKQLATLKSMPDQILPLCAKIGGSYAEWTETDLHRIAHEKHITMERRTRFEDYDGVEPYRAIGFFIKLKAALQKKWNEKWQREKAAREQSLFEDQQIIENCLTWDRVKEWMLANDHYHKIMERFEHVKTIRGVTFWRLREQIEPRLTEREAATEFESYRFADQGYTFQQLYAPCRETGHEGALFKRMFSFNQQGERHEG